mmetsp:Transcript_64374/g.88421  ORF Transcript_64374/g.88421 Transcript_64374/m.88421 type:complete len:222 (+) Transcript_64374:1476-2141(+)
MDIPLQKSEPAPSSSRTIPGVVYEDQVISSRGTEEEIGTYALLPAFWHGMEPQEKKKVMSVIERHSTQFTKDCLMDLHTLCSIPLKEIQNIRICYQSACDTPAQLDMGLPSEPVLMIRAKKIMIGTDWRCSCRCSGTAAFDTWSTIFSASPADWGGTQLYGAPRPCGSTRSSKCFSCNSVASQPSSGLRNQSHATQVARSYRRRVQDSCHHGRRWWFWGED